uniref:NADH-ubiquinone oxidoreductase chain 5 n=1 Tax=Crematogaster teranishii TaxID=2586727 RepID=A0A7L8Y480_9HYME|nr:NADH dehydrogenase subunit 5 [Crematogaster teranishii]QOI14033.1 NADH dehydrogenase subunit 5 [Crematogaster teranishii]
MMNIYMYSIVMFLSFFFISLMSLVFYFMDLGLLMEWMVISVNSFNIEIIILVDWVALLFVGIIFLISSMVVLYSFIYMGSEKFIERFIYMVLLFIFSMVLMIMSPNIISILFGWDGLGLVSYCLVVFYQNYSSYNSGMVTILSNRVGDVGLLMAIGMVMMSGSWNYWVMEIGGQLSMLMIIVAAMTKSAQIPFSVWLPMAMAAPTPVSALVHSSTLVTAGIYLMIRFSEMLMVSDSMSMILLFFSVLTMFMSGIMAIVENDLKKIIALSTLSQLGLMMMILSLGMKMIAFYHLLTHAIFKSMLFMCAGSVIHLMMNNQDIRLLGSLNEVIPFTMMGFYISSLSLCGLPFMAGFYSKDYIMELVYSKNINIFMLGMIMLSLMFTIMYSLRLYYYMFFSSNKFYGLSFVGENKLMSMSLMVLMVLSVMIGSLLSWLFFMDFYMIYLDFSVKIITLMVCLLGLIIMGMMSILSFKIYKSEVSIKIKYFLSSMWFLSYLYMWIYWPFNKIGSVMMNFDSTWGELVSYIMLLSLIKWFKMMFFYYMYLFMILFVLIYMVSIFLF